MQEKLKFTSDKLLNGRTLCVWCIQQKGQSGSKSQLFSLGWADVDFYTWGCVVGVPWISKEYIFIWVLMWQADIETKLSTYNIQEYFLKLEKY